MSAVHGAVSGAFSAIRGVFSSGWSSAVSITSSGISRAVSAASRMASQMVSAGRNFVYGFVNGISGAIGHAVNAAINMARAAYNAAKAALGIHSPSRVMRDQVGYYVVAGMAKGMNRNTELVQKASGRLAQAAMLDTNPFKQSLDGLLTHSNLSQTLSSRISHEVSVNQQPAYISLNLGGTQFSTFVDDISREQGNRANLTRNYRL